MATAHVSHNLDIPFDQLKAKVTGPNAEGLGRAIHGLKPSVNANAEAKKPEKSAVRAVDRLSGVELRTALWRERTAL